jgi:hypothetical protein
MDKVSFDDVLIAPGYSEVDTRSDCDTSAYLAPVVGLDLPVIASNMDTVCESDMCIAMQKNGGVGVLHRNMAISTRVKHLELVKEHGYHAGIAVGIREVPLKVARHFLSHDALYDLPNTLRMAVCYVNDKHRGTMRQKMASNL